MIISKHQHGFSLLEVLIGIVVVSIGLLTVAGLQVVTKKANYEAVQRTTATLLAHDITERMRLNSSALISYVVPVASPIGRGSLGAEPNPTCITSANPCDPTQLATHDLWEWEQALDGATEVASIAGVATQTGGLVLPSACIAGPAAGGTGMYTIAIAWRGTSPLSNPPANACGQGVGIYGANDEYRRVLIYQVFLSA